MYGQQKIVYYIESQKFLTGPRMTAYATVTRLAYCSVYVCDKCVRPMLEAVVQHTLVLSCLKTILHPDCSPDRHQNL